MTVILTFWNRALSSFREMEVTLCTSADFTIESTCRRCGKSRWILLCLTIKISSTHETMYFSFQRGAMYQIGSEVILHKSGIERHEVEFSLNLRCWNSREGENKLRSRYTRAFVHIHTYTFATYARDIAWNINNVFSIKFNLVTHNTEWPTRWLPVVLCIICTISLNSCISFPLLTNINTCASATRHAHVRIYTCKMYVYVCRSDILVLSFSVLW